MNKTTKTVDFCRLRNSLRISKKAISFQLTDWLPKIILLVIVFVFTVFIVESFYRFELNVESIRSEVLAYNLFVSDKLNYYDEEINRLYIGIIDKNKFDNLDLSEYSYGKKRYYSAKLTLLNLDDPNEVIEKYYNKEEYENWIPLSFDKTKYYVLYKEYYVFIKDQGKTSRGKLSIELITPNG